MTNQNHDDPAEIVEIGRSAVAAEIEGLALLTQALDGSFAQAVEVLRRLRGRVVVSGVGKSGHIGRKIAATFASTGTPSFFVHPTEASHGDLGMIASDDALLAISNSGETSELSDMIAYTRRFQLPLLAITGNAKSTLARNSDVLLALPEAPEACPHGLAPTTSTTMALALGDALAVALLHSKGFSAHNFHEFHPGGRLGQLLRKVSELMHRGDALPLCAPATRMSDALLLMTARGFGCVGVNDENGCLMGVITDGDLRRHMSPVLLQRNVESVMTTPPITIAPDALAEAALEKMNRRSITALFVVHEERAVGILHIHDLLRVGIL